jgi:rhamnulokinase
MPATCALLAIDLGAESGRGILGTFDGARVALEAVHRFPNGGVTLLDQMVWDAPGLHREILNCLRIAHADRGGVDSVGIDTWGVDFGFIGRSGTLLGLPRHYRDPHTEGFPDRAFATVPGAEIYQRTGLQFLRFNTLFQLAAMKHDRSPLLEPAEHLLMIPDLLHYWLTGIKANEYTDASTTQMVNAQTRQWDYELAGKFGIAPKMLGSLVSPGTVLGPLRLQVATETGARPIPVIAPATHDTASAVVAVPGKGDDWAYLSSGTWSLLGCELPEPVITDESRAANFTNEGGVDRTIRFLKNIMGLWLVQECRRSFARTGNDFSYDGLTHQAREAEPFRSLIDPDHASFLLPADMPTAITAFCKRTNQPVPTTPGQFARCCFESLAMKYRDVLNRMESLTGRRFGILHVVGGGCQNELLNQFTADAIGRPVVAGPVEATAMGNVMMQARGLGLVSSLEEIREVVRSSCEFATYEPKDAGAWDEQAKRFARVTGK